LTRLYMFWEGWVTLLIILWGLLCPQANAYFLVVVQENGHGYGQVGKEVRWLVFRGEPFQGVIRDSLAPKAFIVLPQGQRQPIALSIINLKDYSSGKERRGYRPHFVPSLKGDYYLCLISPPSFVPGLGEVWQEYSKVALHVDTETNWAKEVGLKAEIVPLTRPYGLEQGTLFRGQVLCEGKPVAGVLVQSTYYHGVYLPVSILPKGPGGKPDSARMYMSQLTDDSGRFALCLPHTGWWLISARLPHGYTMLGNQKLPLILRASIWLYVYPPFTPKEGSFPPIKALPPSPLK